jgi:hypothetical protein
LTVNTNFASKIIPAELTFPQRKMVGMPGRCGAYISFASRKKQRHGAIEAEAATLAEKRQGAERNG